jgi:hypothetical protein
MSKIVQSGIERLEREGEEMTPGQVRKRGLIKAGVGMLVFLAAGSAVAAFAVVEASREPLAASPYAPSFWEGLLKRMLAVIVGVPMVLGLFAMIFGAQQAIFGRPWDELPIGARVLILAIGILAVFGAVIFTGLALVELLAEYSAG